MSDQPKDAPAPPPGEAEARKLNDKEPLTIPENSYFASNGEQRARQLADEYYLETGERLDTKSYRCLDFLDDLWLEQRLTEADIQGRQAEKRFVGDPDSAEAELGKRIDENTREARNRIVSTYGPKEGARLLEATQRWVRTKPELARILQRRGLGSDPEVVERLVRFVHSNGIR